ncbi:MAG TPA: CatA-like O-acetyltransferase [Bacillota bacterium]|nr:CatA-like O-acetyltransferase [Bacillota bacterium]
MNKGPVYLDLKNYGRLQHFEYFKSMAYPYVGITCNVDITEFHEWIKVNGHPFFLSFLWCVAQAANGIEQFRQRICDDKIAEYPFCPTSHTVAKEDGTYSYCTLDCSKPFNEFVGYAASKQEQAKMHGDIEENPEEAQSLLFISSLPWLSYISLVQPVPMPSDSNPRITWGRFYQNGESILMPVSVLCHHALVDGKHIADFYQLLDAKMRQLSDRRR